MDEAHAITRTERMQEKQARLAILMHMEGFSTEEIATTLEVPEPALLSLFDSDTALTLMEDVEAGIIEQVAARGSEVHMKFRASANEALDVLLGQMRFSESESVVQKAALAILDRAGHTPVNRSIHLGAQLPKDIADRMEEALKDMRTVDADYEVLPVVQSEAYDA